MAENILTRLTRIASEILPGRKIETRDRGENYFFFEITDAQGVRSAMPPIWINTDASDRQIKDKLSREIERAYHPELSPDDMSVPNLDTEANHPKVTYVKGRHDTLTKQQAAGKCMAGEPAKQFRSR